MNPELGAPTNLPPQTPQTPAPVIPPVTPASPPQSRRSLVIVVIAVFLCLGIGLAVFWQLSHKPHKQSATQASSINTSNLESAYDNFFSSGVKEFEPAKKASTIAEFKQLSQGFDYNERFFEDKSNLLIALGIAYLSAQDTSKRDSYRNELYVLSSPDLGAVPSSISDQYFNKDVQDKQKSQAVFEKYQNTALSKQMNEAIVSSGIAKEAATNLKLKDASKLGTYHATVMDFDSVSDRQKSFAKEHYMYGAQPKMWVENIEGEIYVLFAKNYAQDFINNPNGEQRHSVIHEFIHAQSSFSRGDLGRSIEERRAETFSGDKSAYYDAKQMFIYSEVFSGLSLTNLLATYPTNPDSFYQKVYAQFGVAGANTIVASWPSVYLGSPSDAIKKTNQLTGGLNGIIEASLAIGQRDTAAMDARLKQRSDKLLSVLKTKDKVLQDIENNLRNNYNMPAAADKMKIYITQHY